MKSDVAVLGAKTSPPEVSQVLKRPGFSLTTLPQSKRQLQMQPEYLRKTSHPPPLAEAQKDQILHLV